MINRLFIITVILMPLTIAAQDANYWSCPYGAGSFVVPGATIARNMDSGVLFYNPALLAYNTKNAAAISGNVYSYYSTKIKNGAGTGLNLHSTSVNITPVIASNTIYLNMKGKPITIAWALLNNPVISFNASQRRDEKFNVLDESYSPGPENFVGQYSLSNSITETSGILAVGKPVSSKMAVGISFTINIRKQQLLIDNRSRVLINNNDDLFQKLVTSTEYYQTNNLNIGLGIKAGLSYDLAENHHIGLLLTAPLIHLYSKADLLSDNVLNNLNLGGTEIFLLANTKQTKLKSKWKMPLSAAAGYTYNYGNGQIYLATEYFNKVKEYNIITPRSELFIRPDTGSSSFTADILKLKDARKAIINFSAAISFKIKEKVTGYCSVRTDFNYGGYKQYPNTDGYIYSTAAWNLYHLNIGSNFRKRRFNLRAGILLTYGTTSNYKQPINYDNPNENNFLNGEPSFVKANRMSAGLMLSYIHNL